MRADAYTSEDLELLADLERAAGTVGVEPYLIGAGAIRLGPALEWQVRPRVTRDWDFAVRLESWSRYEELVTQLTRPDAGFEQAQEVHRFLHRSGGKLDVVPYGGLEDPHGSIHWGDGQVMDTRGLSVLDQHHEIRRIGTVELRIASLPALVGLKVLAYLSRRPGITRDIGDVHRMLVEAEDSVVDARVEADALDRLASEDVSWTEVGAYLVGRDVGRVFADDDRAIILDLLDEATDEASRVVPDILRAPDSAGGSRARVLARLAAFRLGVVDR